MRDTCTIHIDEIELHLRRLASRIMGRAGNGVYVGVSVYLEAN